MSLLQPVVAHHEAGHAVVLYRLTGQLCGSATIIPDHDKGSEGGHNDQGLDSTCVDDIRAQVICCFAGGDAQRRYDPKCGSDGCGSDEELADEYLTWIGEQDRTSEYRLHSADLVEKHWPEIQAVAADLLTYKTLDSEEMQRLADHAAGDPEALADLQSYRHRFVPDRC